MMPTIEADPCLVMIVAGRTIYANNEFRAAQVAEAAVQYRRDPEGFKTFVMRHLQWAEAEAIARDRAGQDVQALPLLRQDDQGKLLSHEGQR